MNMQICPYCKEKIYSNAIVCRYCKRDLPSEQASSSRSCAWLTTLIASALIVGGTALAVSGFLRERKNWTEQKEEEENL